MRSPEPSLRRVPLEGDYGVPGRRPRGPVDWSRYVHRVDLAGSPLSYLDHGDPGTDRPVFVLVHGLGGRWQHWTENIPELAEHGRVVAVDLPGFGGSASPADGYSVDGFADVVAGLVVHLGLSGVVVVGHSLGGPVALRTAQRHPGLVSGVVLAAGTIQAFAGVLGGQQAVRRLLRKPATVAATCFEVLTAGLPAPAFVRRLVVEHAWLRRLVLWPYLRHPAVVPAASAALLVDGAGTRGVLPAARAAGRLRPEDWLAAAGCPVLAVGADHDAIAPLSELAAFAAAVPGARTVVLEGTGHLLMLERASAFTAEVVAFARQVAPPA